MSKLSCSLCHTGELKIVGCYVYAPVGVEYTPTFSFLDLKPEGAFETQQLLQCDQCKQHVALKDALANIEIVRTAVYWETSVNGHRVPVVCPVCKNTTDFIREELQLYEQSVNVTLYENTVESGDLLSSMPRRGDRVTIKYVCAKEACTGVVTVNTDLFTVSRL